MHINAAIASAILLFCARVAVAAPVPQLGGEGTACNYIVGDTDNGTGYGTENVLDNTGATVATLNKGQAAPAAPAAKRQLNKIADGAATFSNDAGTGQYTGETTDGLVALDESATTGAGNIGEATGYTEENALEDAGESAGVGAAGSNSGGNNGASSGGPPPPPPPPPKRMLRKRQLNKIADGAATFSNDAGTGQYTGEMTDGLVALDESATTGAGNIGEATGYTEENALEDIGESAGVGAVGQNSAGGN